MAGFVIDTYKCPPCPTQAMCKPCIGDHIVVAEGFIDGADQALFPQLRIFTDKPERFKLQQQYSFTVKVKGKVAPGHAIQDLDLISFKPVKE